MENESYLHITSPITHFQSVDQYYTILKIKKRPFNNKKGFLAKSLGKQDTFGAHCKQLATAADAMFPTTSRAVWYKILVSYFTQICTKKKQQKTIVCSYYYFFVYMHFIGIIVSYTIQ